MEKEDNIDLQEGRRRRLERKGWKELRLGQSRCRAHAPGKSLSILMFKFLWDNFKVCHTWSSTEDRSRGRSEEGSREEVEEEEEEKKELGERRREEWEGGRDRELDEGKDG